MKANAPVYQPEHGPPLLTPIGADAEIENTKAWTTKISSNLIPQYACAFVRSNLWPGAYTFARGMIWENIYVGYGHKYTSSNYKAEFPPLPANEYDGPEMNEADDPTPEDEAKANAPEEQEEGEDDHEEGLENDDDED
jgi:radial spoke head protein 4A